jgi:hypothetical protein
MIWDFTYFLSLAHYEEMQYIFIRKYTVFIGLSSLKVTRYDIKSDFYTLETKEI